MFDSVADKLRENMKVKLYGVKLRVYENRVNLTYSETGILSPPIERVLNYLQKECIPYMLKDDGLNVSLTINTMSLSIGEQINLSNIVTGG